MTLVKLPNILFIDFDCEADFLINLLTAISNGSFSILL